MERKKIIVVDDDTLLAKTMRICLSKRGYDARVFYNGTDAIKCLTEEKPDLLILDLRLPDCDGWSLAKFVERCEWAETVPLIIISALEPDRVKIAEVKPFAYIQKPFDMGQFMQIVERSLAGETSLAYV
jgi:DNA-binding response OmpR family regulator